MTESSAKSDYCIASNKALIVRVNDLDKRLSDVAPDSSGDTIRELFIDYLGAVADAVYAMRFDEVLEVNGKDRYWDIPGAIVEHFVQHVEYRHKDTNVRPGWLTEENDPHLWAVYDAAHDLDIDERCFDDWERLFVAIEALRRGNISVASAATLGEAASAG